MELYLHIPFCRSKCRYCDFASWPGKEERMAEYVDALLQEAAWWNQQLPGEKIETVFLGGGTPSVLPPALLDRLLSGLHRLFPWEAGVEFTSEANPGTLTEDWLKTAIAHGVNRLSLGMQAAQPELLRTLGRIHTMGEVYASVTLARQLGIDNLSLDLMFGLPGQSLSQWEETLRTAFSLAPEHISCYGLIPEECTPLWEDLQAGRLSLPEEEAERAMYDLAISLCAKHGLVQYEISNFARPGRDCAHNLGYWRQIPYLGLGVAAASMLPDPEGKAAYLRWTNPSTLDAYLRMLSTGSHEARSCEPVSRKEARFETLMLGLRTTAGIHEDDFLRMHGVSLESLYGSRLVSLSERGLLAHENRAWRLTRRGMDIQNSILVELMDE